MIQTNDPGVQPEKINTLEIETGFLRTQGRELFQTGGI
jgi:hypothetical protein